MRILIVEDDADIAELISGLLTRNTYVVDCQPRIDLAVEAILSAHFDLVILDRTLPDGDGLSIIPKLRRKLLQDAIPPFLVLSALGDTEEKVFGLDSGAIDYLVKPYDPDELLARVRACLRRRENQWVPIIHFGNSEYDPKKRTLTVGGAEVALRRKEVLILDLLMRHRETVIPHNRLEQAVYSYDDEIASNTLNSHVSRLRKALRESGSGLTITVLRHIGYILKADG